MDVGQLKTHFRRQIDDVLLPYQVDDESFYAYLTEAQQEACIRANLIRDKSSSFCTIPVTAGKDVYVIHPSIYAIRYASFVDSAGRVTTLSSTSADELDHFLANWREQSDKPKWFIHEDTTVELAHSPSENGTLKLDVYRLPLEDIASDGDELEIAWSHHLSLLHWVMAKAFSIPDSDLFQPGKASEHEMKFIQLFGHRPSANQRRRQYRDTPHRNKVSPL